MKIVTTTRGRNGGVTPSTPIQTKDIADNAVTRPKLSEDVRQSLAAADGAVRYDAAQEMTTAEQEQAFDNLGLPTVFVKYSELGNELTIERFNEIKSATNIVLLREDNTSILFVKYGVLSDGNNIWFISMCNNTNLALLWTSSSNNIINYERRDISDPAAVSYKLSQSLTNVQQQQARQNIDAMANTPSGDPMHYMYEVAGAEWIPYADISTEGLEDWQVETLDRAQAQADGGVWWHNDIFVTVAQNRINYVLTIGNYAANATAYVYYLRRTNVTTNYKENMSVSENKSLAEAVRVNGTIRTVLLSTMSTNNMGYAFNYCARLCRVIGTIDVSNVSSFNNTFVECPNLRYINLYGLNTNVNFSGDGKLSLESLIFMITNAGTATLTITLASAVYTAAMADSAVQAALAAKPNVTLANAGATGIEN